MSTYPHPLGTRCRAWLLEQGFFQVDAGTWRLDVPGAMLFVLCWSQEPRVTGHVTLTGGALDAACYSPTWAAPYGEHLSVDEAVDRVAREGLSRLAEHALSGTLPFQAYATSREHDEMLA